ncbi:FR47-like protein [Seminavis robusta]|uniref:FR47-like protein n=1 Tax=Seminavis robusta TaxID=568900 RepID=A0A9N8H209_9STRA|nr:FR47-like protein [Seminavis robusta]|eukprot:Sro27_g018050.1 FR47-like protein (350) ;mRNA; f:20337-21386
MAEEHAADEAAGEVIFSSDGLPPTTISPRKRPSTLEKVDDGDMTVLDSGDTNPAVAFEIFSGKVYPVSSAQPKSTTGIIKSETPAERLARLQQEITELEQDLASANTAEEAGGGGPALMGVVTDLQQRLKTQAGVTAKNQEEMTRSIQMRLQEWEASKNATSPAEAAAGAPVATTSPDLEERLLQVEKLVGGGATTTTSTSLLTRLEEMEAFLKGLDLKGLEQASAKAKVIRSDLEAASKARNKLASAATFRKEDAKTISSLYDQMSQLEGLSGHLPALVARLQQLANLHAQSSTYALRLTQSEQEMVQLQAVVKSLEETVTKAETGMAENVKVIENNMQQLDERIKKL